jgi:hypothetical protein
MRYFKVIFFLLITSTCIASLPHYERWLSDFNEAKEMAQRQNRPLLIAFLGRQWCDSSDQLEEEILDSGAFLTALENKVVFLKVNIPAVYEENALVDQYNIDSCPTLLLVEAGGHEIAKLDLSSIDAMTINTLLADYDRVQNDDLCNLRVSELQSLYARAGKFADATFKQTLLEEGLKVDEGPFFMLEQYGHLLAEVGVKNRKSKTLRNRIIARDIKNEQGYRRQLAIMDFEALCNETLAAKAVIKPLMDYLQKFGSKDVENAWQIELKISRYLFSRDQIEDALKHANASLKMAPEAKRNEIAKSVDYLKTVSSKAQS